MYLKHITHDRSQSWLGRGNSNKLGGANLLFGYQQSYKKSLNIFGNNNKVINTREIDISFHILH